MGPCPPRASCLANQEKQMRLAEGVHLERRHAKNAEIEPWFGEEIHLSTLEDKGRKKKRKEEEERV